MKKIITLILTLALGLTAVFSLTACGKKDKVVEPGSTIVVGVTDYAPMDYLEDGKWVGFDADLATKVFTNLGFKVEFKEIDWDTKIVTLNAGTIDCIWNGMTVNNELLDNLLLTNVYLKNQQVAVMKTANADSYNTLNDIKNKNVAVESGSAAESACEDIGCGNISKLTNQVTALLNVSTNQADVAIVDYALAKELTSEGGSYYGTLTMKNIGFEIENFSAAVRKSDSKLLWQINEQIALLTADGTVATLAETYGILNQLPANFVD
ncbi:MAG: transporter substrate-binding domain-containing protein [Firmicutes bacterium]|nr:transporter substrate-binding domain-containing protein [Candidatus Caballimonas caccae]